MFITDKRKDFFQCLVGQRVLLLVAYDVDAVCATKILQYLFHCEQVSYTLLPVNGRQDLYTALKDNNKQMKHVVMINCGANFDVMELKPDEETVFYIADTRRPIDVHNIYNAKQVKLLMNVDDENNIPVFEDIFREDSEDEDDSGNESPDSASQERKRRRFDERTLEKGQKRRLWEQNREKVLFNYYQFNSYGSSTATLMYDLAWKMSKENNDLLWWAIVGLTELFQNGKMEYDKYVLDCGNLQLHVARLNRGETKDVIGSIDCVKIAYDKEMCLSLYRHWSLLNSIKHTMYTSCKFKMWTLAGPKKVQEYLVDVGLPLAQAEQQYSSMSIELRENVKVWIEEKNDKYGFDKMMYGSFHIKHGFSHRYCASDIVLAASALLDSVSENSLKTENFHDAVDCLTRANDCKLRKGIKLAKSQLEVIFKQVQTFLDTSQVVSAGPFLYAVVTERTADARFFSYPTCLKNLARFLLHAQVTVSRSKKTRNLPLILSAPYIEREGMCIITGIPPVSKESPKNFFGVAFEEAMKITKSRIDMDFFDTSTILIDTEDRSKFLDALISILS